MNIKSPKECYIIQILNHNRVIQNYDLYEMNVYSTKELHNCKVESEAAGLNNGSSLKRKSF